MTFADPDRAPWDQKKGEPDKWHSWFLIYRNLGPGRSVDLAYRFFVGESPAKKHQKRQPPRKCSGEWSEASRLWSWPARAIAWDIANLQQHGQKIVTLQLAILERYALKILAALDDERAKPKNWREITEAMKTLGTFISPEILESAVRAGAGGAGTDAPETSGSGAT